MTDPDALVAFLTARLDEDEWIAQGAARTDDGHGGQWLPVHFGAGGFDARVDDHIALHDPARALREVAARRRIIFLATRLPALTKDHEWYDNNRDAWAEVLRQLAAVYSSHPDYLPGWKP